MSRQTETACLFPGSFDPFTLGHLDVALRAAARFDRVVVAVLRNPAKPGWLTWEQRAELIRACLPDCAAFEIVAFEGLLAEAAKQLGVHTVARGLRTAADFENEAAMARLNRALAAQLDWDLETVFLAASPGTVAVSASAVREIAAFAKDVRPLLTVMPPEAARLLLSWLYGEGERNATQSSL